MMKKKNLMTLQDRTGLYDIWKCDKCGHEKKFYGLVRSSVCPKCSDGKSATPIYGGWSSRDCFFTSDRRCPFCKENTIETPKEGHPNSKYWNLQRTADELLFCCPNGCLEDGSNRLVRKSCGIKITR